MDASCLAMEMASIIMWQKGQRPETYKQFWNQPSKPQSNTNVDPVQNYNEWDMLAGLCSSAYIPSCNLFNHGICICECVFV